jgi:hypothetical protein
MDFVPLPKSKSPSGVKKPVLAEITSFFKRKSKKALSHMQ